MAQDRRADGREKKVGVKVNSAQGEMSDAFSVPSPSAITYHGYRDSSLHLSARKTSPGEKHRRLILLPHSDVSPELEPKVTRQVSVPMLFFVDHPSSDSENSCLVLSQALGRSALESCRTAKEGSVHFTHPPPGPEERALPSA